MSLEIICIAGLNRRAGYTTLLVFVYVKTLEIIWVDLSCQRKKIWSEGCLNVEIGHAKFVIMFWLAHRGLFSYL